MRTIQPPMKMASSTHIGAVPRRFKSAFNAMFKISIVYFLSFLDFLVDATAHCASTATGLCYFPEFAVCFHGCEAFGGVSLYRTAFTPHFLVEVATVFLFVGCGRLEASNVIASDIATLSFLLILLRSGSL